LVNDIGNLLPQADRGVAIGLFKFLI